VLSGKVTKFSITFTLDISSDSTPYPIRGVLRDHHQSKSESVFKVLPLMRCVPMSITFSLFIRLEHMSNEWKVENVNYEFGIASFLRLYLDYTPKFKILRSLKSDQPRISAAQSTSKCRNS
jgi:hypothetical protein